MAVARPVKTGLAIASALVTASFLACLPASDSREGQGRPSSDRSPFLKAFLAPNPAIAKKPVAWVSALGEQRGWLFRAETNERLPSLLLIASPGANDFFQQTARELAGIGFAVLLVEVNGQERGAQAGPTVAKQDDAIRLERTLAELCSAVRWLRRRDDLFPDKVGALGWGTSAHWALELAAAQNLQAAVLNDFELPLVLDGPLSVGLRQTPVLLVRGAAEDTQRDRRLLEGLRRAFETAHVEHRILEFKSAKAGFMGSGPRDTYEARSANQAWFEIYEFLGKQVEDAELKTPQTTGPSSDVVPAAPPHVSIGDVMRAVNGATGVCGEVAQSLGEGLREEKDWKLLRARAALMSDAGVLLLELKPPRGTQASWRRHAASYRDAATALTAAVDRRNLADARQAFERLKTTCNRCHSDHR
jgi:dienelactone hydrolase